MTAEYPAISDSDHKLGLIEAERQMLALCHNLECLKQWAKGSVRDEPLPVPWDTFVGLVMLSAHTALWCLAMSKMDGRPEHFQRVLDSLTDLEEATNQEHRERWHLEPGEIPEGTKLRTPRTNR